LSLVGSFLDRAKRLAIHEALARYVRAPNRERYHLPSTAAGLAIGEITKEWIPADRQPGIFRIARAFFRDAPPASAGFLPPARLRTLAGRLHPSQPRWIC
jgi:hypothetical protein